MYKYLVVMIIAFSSVSCSSQEQVVVVGQEKLEFTLNEFQSILQQALDLNHLDFLFDKKDRENGVVIVINDFIEPFYKDLTLTKFDKKVRFRTHKETFDDKNEKFFDVLKGSILKTDDTLTVILGLRFKNTAVQAQYQLHEKTWKIITGNKKTESNETATLYPLYNYKMDKEQCLVNAILKVKEPEKYKYLRQCEKFSYDYYKY